MVFGFLGFANPLAGVVGVWQTPARVRAVAAHIEAHDRHVPAELHTGRRHLWISVLLGVVLGFVVAAQEFLAMQGRLSRASAPPAASPQAQPEGR